MLAVAKIFPKYKCKTFFLFFGGDRPSRAQNFANCTFATIMAADKQVSQLPEEREGQEMIFGK